MMEPVTPGLPAKSLVMDGSRSGVNAMMEEIDLGRITAPTAPWYKSRLMSRWRRPIGGCPGSMVR